MIQNLEIISLLFLLFICSVLANLCLGIELNVVLAKDKFDFKRLFNGLFKALMLGLGLLLLTVVVSYLPSVLTLAGLEMTEELSNSISILLIVSVMVGSIKKYFTKTLEKIKKVLDLTSEEIENL